MTTQHRVIIVICVAFVALVHGEQRIAATGEAAGSLLVESDPAGASVYVDGRLAGETPVTLSAIAVGVHRVRVLRLGYLENSRLVTIKPDARATLRAQLTDPAPQTAKAAALKIVVVEGEGAVNIIQQKTAVAPIVEVRDRNDQPVSGAVVRFAIEKGRASFNGARTLTVTTDAAGRATATGFTPIGNGTLRIGATAAFQGQTAAASIAQTSVMTSAEASSLASVPSAPASGGGSSHLAIAGIAGGAGAGIAGALLASKKSSGSSSASRRGRSTGPVNTLFIMTTSTGSSSCASTRSITGTLTIQLDERSDGTVTGQGSTSGTESETAITQSPVCQASFGTVGFAYRGAVTGSTGNMTFNQQTISTSTSPATVTVTNTFAFTGTLSNGVITGTVTYSEASSGQSIPPFNTPISGSGSTTFAVTLR